MKLISPHIAHKLLTHACWFATLPTITVPSAAVTDQDTEAWSQELYDRDLANEPQQRISGCWHDLR